MKSVSVDGYQVCQLNNIRHQALCQYVNSEIVLLVLYILEFVFLYVYHALFE
jgi:hypothetical protein